jgi:hypothetical protein
LKDSIYVFLKPRLLIIVPQRSDQPVWMGTGKLQNTKQTSGMVGRSNACSAIASEDKRAKRRSSVGSIGDAFSGRQARSVGAAG